jgi:hypothetical protein
MVSLDFLQHDYPRPLQLQRARNLGRNEQPWSRRCSVSSSSERRQCAHFLPNGRQLLLQQCDCTLRWDQGGADVWNVSVSRHFPGLGLIVI